jgi:hypothetical protein
MKHKQRQHWRRVAARFWCRGWMLLVPLAPVAAQDIRGMEVCTAEKSMERRTGCLQANVEFLERALTKLARETQTKLAGADRDLAAARAVIAELKATVTKLQGELAQMKAKAEPDKKN